MKPLAKFKSKHWIEIQKVEEENFYEIIIHVDKEGKLRKFIAVDQTQAEALAETLNLFIIQR